MDMNEDRRHLLVGKGLETSKTAIALKDSLKNQIIS